MKFQQKLCVGLLFLTSFVRAVDDDGGWDDDDGWSPGGLCYYDEQCLFACGDAATPEECVDMPPVRPDGIVFTAPFHKANAGGACVPTSDGKRSHTLSTTITSSAVFLTLLIVFPLIRSTTNWSLL